jgi:hypothetical protein
MNQPTESESAEVFSTKRIGQAGRPRNAYAPCCPGGRAKSRKEGRGAARECDRYLMGDTQPP